MSVNTVLFDFTVDPSTVKNDQQLSAISSNIEIVLRDLFTNFKQISTIPIDNGDLMKLYTAENGVVVTLRFFIITGLITLNMEYRREESQDPLYGYERRTAFVKAIEHNVGKIRRSESIVPIRRGHFGRYFATSDDRLLEYDIDEVVFEERTPYQNVQIVHSGTCGNMLVLDGFQNLAESDLVYTETLMARGTENYKDKEVLILGGGDGALLYELLKEKPKEVIMLEIDEVVMKACAKHMRSVCGDVLDNYNGANYKIILGDCMKFIDLYMKEGRKFDYIFSDLTDIPLSELPTGELWDFVNKILNVSFKLLKPKGKFMTHVIGTVATQALEMYESQLKKLDPPVKFTTSKAWVPSFLEEWQFYQVFLDQKE